MLIKVMVNNQVELNRKFRFKKKLGQKVLDFKLKEKLQFPSWKL